MEKIIKETVVTDSNGITQTKVAQVETRATETQTLIYLVYFFFGVLDILLVSRYMLRLFGASTANSFVELVYGITGILIAPFVGIFRIGVSQGVETSSVFEPATLIAIIVYLVLAWGIARLIEIVSGKVLPE